MAGNLVKFVITDSVAFDGLTAKDENTLYFVSDQRRIFKGATPYSGGIYKDVTSFPTAGEVNTIYLNTTNGEVRFWNGSAYQTLVKPTSTSISGAGDDTHTATTKAIVDYVASKIADLSVGKLEGRVSTLETGMDTVKGQITTINGTGEGSIAKAKTDAIAAAKTYTDTEVAKKANVKHSHTLADITDAGKVAGLNAIAEANLDATLAAKINGKANAATTLAGYGITDAYTKTATDSAIATAVANAGHLKREIVEALPAVDAANEHTIYMVAKTGGAGNQHYDEYMLINGAFEKIGDSAVDLTDYATKTEVATAKSEAISTAATDATSKANKAKTDAVAAAATDATTKANKAKEDAIAAAATDATSKANAAQKAAITAAGTAADGKITAAIGALDVTDTAVASQYVSSVSETDGKIKVTRASLPAAATLVEGTANGTVKFNGTDVKVHGLGSAAYTASTDYDKAGAANEALTAAKQYVESLLTWQEL